MERTSSYESALPAAPPTAADDIFGDDREVQRRAMVAMVAAMATMLAGLPLHLTGAAHGTGMLAGWLAAPLATLAIGAALPTLRPGCRPPTLGRGEQGLILCCAACAYALGWAGLLAGNHTLLYFDVAAMSVASLPEGRALEASGRRQSLAAAQQLAMVTGAQWVEPPLPARRGIAWPLAAGILAAALLAAALAGAAGSAALAALATAAACCPCMLGRARASSLAAAQQLARRDGWIVASPQALAAGKPYQAAIGLPGADPQRLHQLGRAALAAARLNVVWAALVPALLLPLALRGPVDPLLPAAAMAIAWAAIGLTNRLCLGRSAF